ncbi:MAG: N-acetyl sugar amidotransferase, partial [Aridibacter sp.]
IYSGQMTKDQALKEIAEPPYPAHLLREDKEYILKKFEISEEEFDKIMAEKPIPHTDYPSIMNIYKALRKIVKPFKR